MADQISKNSNSTEIRAHGTEFPCGFFDEKKQRVSLLILIVVTSI